MNSTPSTSVSNHTGYGIGSTAARPTTFILTGLAEKLDLAIYVNPLFRIIIFLIYFILGRVYQTTLDT